VDAEAAARHGRVPEVRILEDPNWSRRGGGSGLGLAIRRRIRGGGNETAAAVNDASMDLCGCVRCGRFALCYRPGGWGLGAKKFALEKKRKVSVCNADSRFFIRTLIYEANLY